MIEKFSGIFLDAGFYFNKLKKRDFSIWFFNTIRKIFYKRMDFNIYVLSLTAKVTKINSSIPLLIKKAEVDDLLYFKEDVPPSERRRFKKRLEQGRICFIALFQNRLAAYCWAADKIVFSLDNVQLKLEPGDVYIDDNYTSITFRNKGIQSELQSRLLMYLHEMGFLRAVLIVEAANIASQKMVAKLGYKKNSQLILKRVLFKRFYRSKNTTL